MYGMYVDVDKPTARYRTQTCFGTRAVLGEAVIERFIDRSGALGLSTRRPRPTFARAALASLN